MFYIGKQNEFILTVNIAYKNVNFGWRLRDQAFMATTTLKILNEESLKHNQLFIHQN